MNNLFKNIKNFVEVKDDVAIIHVNRAGFEHLVLVDKEDLSLINHIVKNRLNIDTNGYVQHRKMVNGEWRVFQLHRKIAGAFNYETVGFKNGNKLDLRKENLFFTDDNGKTYPVI
jgi:hypothetical protein